MTDKIVKGLHVYNPRHNGRKVPQFVIANMMINIKEFIEWASLPENNVDGYVFFDLYVSEDSEKIPYQKINAWRYANNGVKPSQKKKSTASIDIMKKHFGVKDLPE